MASVHHAIYGLSKQAIPQLDASNYSVPELSEFVFFLPNIQKKYSILIWPQGIVVKGMLAKCGGSDGRSTGWSQCGGIGCGGIRGPSICLSQSHWNFEVQIVRACYTPETLLHST